MPSFSALAYASARLGLCVREHIGQLLRPRRIDQAAGLGPIGRREAFVRGRARCGKGVYSDTLKGVYSDTLKGVYSDTSFFEAPGERAWGTSKAAFLRTRAPKSSMEMILSDKPKCDSATRRWPLYFWGYSEV